MKRVISSFSKLQILLAAILITLIGSGCGAPPVKINSPLFSGKYYLSHNLKFEQDGAWRVGHRSNYLANVTSPVARGSEVSIEFYSAQHIEMDIEGIPFRMHNLGTEFPSDEAGIARFMEKHFVRDAQQLDSIEISAQSQSSVERGEAALGMTKEEVILAIGYPMAVGADLSAFNMTREEILNHAQWIYPYQNILLIPFNWQLQFDSNGILRNVIR